MGRHRAARWRIPVTDGGRHGAPGTAKSERMQAESAYAVAPGVCCVLQSGQGPWWHAVEQVLEACTGEPSWRVDLRDTTGGQELDVIRAVRESQSQEPGGPPPTLVVVRASTGLRDHQDGDVHLIAMGDQVDAQALTTELISLAHPRVAQTVAFTGSCGGLGVTTTVAVLALALRRKGLGVAIMDLDPAGGLDMLLGGEPLRGLRWADLDPLEGAFLPPRLVNALPTWHGVTILTGDARGGSDPAVRAAALRALAAMHDVVLVDLPRGQVPPPGAIPVLLTSLDLRHATAAEALARLLPKAEAKRLRLLLRSGGLDLGVAELEGMTGGALLGVVRFDRSVVQRQARGEDLCLGRGALVRDVNRLADALIDLMEPWDDPEGLGEPDLVADEPPEQAALAGDEETLEAVS
ncbi:cobalamin biosynthesis protein CobQ [Actinomyces trachealis]|uniref:cobalamin biosynthesis protein CobQ n=1 Tax=Actinomyces trachealis TaxID=2763540 RepID=UPI0018C855FA|nr:cobalamin biosynthesis protein CobQ [Actinomyces trachealis]